MSAPTPYARFLEWQREQPQHLQPQNRDIWNGALDAAIQIIGRHVSPSLLPALHKSLADDVRKLRA